MLVSAFTACKALKSGIAHGLNGGVATDIYTLETCGRARVLSTRSTAGFLYRFSADLLMDEFPIAVGRDRILSQFHKLASPA